MYRLMYLILTSATLAEFFSSQGVHGGPNFAFLPGPVKFITEGLSIVCAAYVAVAGLRRRFDLVPAKYILLFCFVVAIIVCGILTNGEAPGPTLSGMRYYLRAIPFFVLPAVVDITEAQFRRLLLFTLGLSLLQAPVSMYQRYFLESTGHVSGDGVTGTMMDSGAMTLFLICAICVLAAAMLRGRIKKPIFAFLFVILLIPISIDETKVTVFVFPPAILTTFLIAAAPGKKIRVLFAGLGIMIVGGLIFVPIYDFFNRLHVDDKKEQITIAQMFTDPTFLPKYLNSKSSVGNGEVGHVGRIDAVTVPLRAFYKDPVRLAFGLGIGNASQSSIGPAYTGKYYGVYGPFVFGFSSGSFLIETGVLGFFLILLIHWLILRDSLFVARNDTGLMELLAIGWVGVSVVIILGIFYIGLHGVASISYAYWLFSGFVTARAARMKRERAVSTQKVRHNLRHPPVSVPDNPVAAQVRHTGITARNSG